MYGSLNGMTFLVLLAACFNSTLREPEVSAVKSGDVPLPSGDAQPEDGALVAWGVAPYDAHILTEPIHPPRVRYVDLYWSQVQPTREPATVEGVRAALRGVLRAPLEQGPPVAVRFITTGQLSEDGDDILAPAWLPEHARGGGKCRGEDNDQDLILWSDPDILQAHRAVVEVLGQALDGHPSIAWVESGSYGFWGEWHTDQGGAHCAATVPQRIALAQPWVEAFQKTPLVVLMDSIKAKEDPEHKLRAVWSSAANPGLRFDCLGFWHDEYREVVLAMHQDGVTSWTGPWGGEFCGSEIGARWATGLPITEEEQRTVRWAPEAVKQMSPEQRRSRTLKVVQACGWSHITGAGAVLLENGTQNGEAAKALEDKMSTTRSLEACAEALR